MPIPTSFKGSDAQKDQPLEAGTYRCRLKEIKAFDPDQARAEGKKTTAKEPSLKAVWVVQDEGDCFGRHLFDSMTLTAGKNFMLRKFLDAIAWDDDKDIITDGVFVAEAEMIDVECNLVIEVEPARTVEGTTYDVRNRVKQFISVFGQ